MEDDGPPSTRHLYMVDEVLSAMQKAVRRSLHDETLFWTNELHTSGLGALAIARFGVMCSEDVSLGCPALPQYVLEARRSYYSCVKQNQLEDAGRVLLGCSHVLSNACKNRMPATAAVWLYAKMESEMVNASHVAKQRESRKAHWLLGSMQARVNLLKQSMTACVEDPQQFQKHEEQALLAMQSLFLDDKSTQIWRAVLAMKPPQRILQDSMAALYTLVQERGCSAERYCMIHAIMLYTRQNFFHADKLQPVQTPTTPSSEDLLNLFPGRAFGIPQYAIDKHTRRGGGGGKGVAGKTVKGRSTLAELPAAAAHWRVDVSGWDAEEVAKSHGEGVERACDTSVGPDTLLSHFYKDGVVVADEYIPRPPHTANALDPYRGGAEAFNLALERRFRGPIPKGVAREQSQERLR